MRPGNRNRLSVLGKKLLVTKGERWMKGEGKVSMLGPKAGLKWSSGSWEGCASNGALHVDCLVLCGWNLGLHIQPGPPTALLHLREGGPSGLDEL